MKISFKPDPPHFPICWDCEEPIIEGEEYYHIGKNFYHAECWHDYHVQYMTDGGAE
ncbi:MAG: hypothetical protein IIZ43_01435 [Eubacterium sp.]|nr:hypothetical protein [Eubacterium sp.]